MTDQYFTKAKDWVNKCSVVKSQVKKGIYTVNLSSVCLEAVYCISSI